MNFARFLKTPLEHKRTTAASSVFSWEFSLALLCNISELSLLAFAVCQLLIVSEVYPYIKLSTSFAKERPIIV